MRSLAQRILHAQAEVKVGNSVPVVRGYDRRVLVPEQTDLTSIR